MFVCLFISFAGFKYPRNDHNNLIENSKNVFLSKRVTTTSVGPLSVTFTCNNYKVLEFFKGVCRIFQGVARKGTLLRTFSGLTV